MKYTRSVNRLRRFGAIGDNGGAWKRYQQEIAPGRRRRLGLAVWLLPQSASRKSQERNPTRASRPSHRYAKALRRSRHSPTPNRRPMTRSLYRELKRQRRQDGTHAFAWKRARVPAGTRRPTRKSERDGARRGRDGTPG